LGVVAESEAKVGSSGKKELKEVAQKEKEQQRESLGSQVKSQESYKPIEGQRS